MPLLLNNGAASLTNGSEIDSYMSSITITLTYENPASGPKGPTKGCVHKNMMCNEQSSRQSCISTYIANMEQPIITFISS